MDDPELSASFRATARAERRLEDDSARRAAWASATLANIALGAANAGHQVTAEGLSGERHTGAVAAVGQDHCLLDGRPAIHLNLAHGYWMLRRHTDAAHQATRSQATPSRFTAVLNEQLALADGPTVEVHLHGGRQLTVTLLAVAADHIRVRHDRADLHIPHAAVAGIAAPVTTDSPVC